MRKTKEEAALTRNQLLEAALTVFGRKGYSAATLEEIASEAGLTRGAIYWHFDGKEALYQALITEKSAGINQLAEEILASGGTPREILQRLLLEMFRYVEENAEYQALLELAVSKVEVTPGLESTMEETTQGRRLLTELFTDLLRRGIEIGEFRSNLPAEDAAIALVGYLNGLGLIWIQDPEAFSILERADALVDVFFMGIEA